MQLVNYHNVIEENGEVIRQELRYHAMNLNGILFHITLINVAIFNSTIGTIGDSHLYKYPFS